MHIKTHSNAGFTLVEIMIVVAIIGLLAAIAVPSLIRAREQAQLKSIQNNLRVIDGAKDMWALEEKKGTGEDPGAVDALAAYFKNGKINPVVNETYTPDKVGSPPFATLPANVKLGTYLGGTKIEPQ